MSETPVIDPKAAYLRVLEDRANVTGLVSTIVRVVGFGAVGLFLSGHAGWPVALGGLLTVALDYGQYLAGIRSSTEVLDAGGDYKYRPDQGAYRLRFLFFAWKQAAAIATLLVALSERFLT